ncbi:MAG TPA: ferritin [Syntrophomonas sp.]|jgi:rubrerythrin|nr:ferritin [Syntrophomonas sp.]
MPTKQIQNIIIQAIASELEAYDYYTSLSRQLIDQEAAKICKCLAEEEWQHRAALKSLLDNGLTALFESPGDSKLTDHKPVPRLSAEMKPADALLLAIKKEAQAAEDYAVLAQLSKRDEEKQLFERLIIMEQGHKAHLEKIYHKLFA